MRQPIKFGKYLLLERIAVGGMAEVFVAKAFGVEGFERLLAIKKILPTMGEDPEFNTMFVDEARIAVQLSHANIVQVLDLGKHDESLFIAMEYVSGRDVRQLMERFRKRNEPMPVPQACTVVGKVCEALDYAHRKRDATGRPLGIVHRDVSPQNVLVSFEGDVKLIDFGIAKAESRLQRTQAGILKGKFSYMSPEQVRGQPIDHRSDVFAAGVLLWEMLCGQKLFTGESDFAVLEKVRNGVVPEPRTLNPRIPEALERVVLKALAADVAERYQWASELHDALVRFTLIGDYVYGARQLSEWMREEFHAEYAKEQARLRGWLGIEDPEIEVTPSDPHRSVKRAAKPGAPAGPAAPGLAVPAQAPAPRPPPGGTAPGRAAQAAPREEAPLVQQPTPSGIHRRVPASKTATPPPGELKPPVLLPEVAELQGQQAAQRKADLSTDAPTLPMSAAELAKAELLLAEMRAEKPPPALGDGEEERTLKDGAGFAKGAQPRTTPQLGRGAPGRPPPLPVDSNPSIALPLGLGPDEKTPAATPFAKGGLGPHDPTPAFPVPAARPEQSVPAPASSSRPKPAPAPPAALRPAPPAPPAAEPKGDPAMAAIADEATRPMQVPQAFDVSEDSTAAPRKQRTQGLTRASRPEPRASDGRSRTWLWAAGLVAAGALIVWLVMPESQAAPAKLVVTVVPSVPAELLVDGKPAGALPPFVRSLAPGPHRVEVRAGGFRPFSREITLQPGARPLELEAALQLEGAPLQVEGVELKGPAAPTAPPAEVVPREPNKPPWLTGSKAPPREAPKEAPQAKEPPVREAAAAPKEPPPAPKGAPAGPSAPARAAQEPPPAPAAAKEPQREAPRAQGKPELAPPPAEAPAAPKAEPKTRVRLVTTPPGATVLLNDQPVGKTPLVLEGLDAVAIHRFTLQLEGHKQEKRLVKLDEAPVRELTVNLVALKPAEPPATAPEGAPAEPKAEQPKPALATGNLVIMSNPVARVRIDGADTGRWTPVPPNKPIALSPGSYTVELEAANGHRFEKKVTIEPGKTERLFKMDL